MMWAAVLMAALRDLEDPGAMGPHVRGTGGYSRPPSAAAWFRETSGVAMRDQVGSFAYIMAVLGLDEVKFLFELEARCILPVPFEYLFGEPCRSS